MTQLIYLLIVIATLLNTGEAQEIKATRIQASSVALNNPHDLKLTPDGDYLLVSDVGNNRVAMLDPQTLELVGAFGADHQSGTHDIDFDAQGQVFVADTHNNRVTIYQLDGKIARLVGELTDRIRGPEGVLVHRNGKVYVAGAWSGNVVVYENGRVVAELDGLSSPHDLEQTDNGDIWLSDSGNHRILLLSSELEIKRELGRQTYNFNGVRYLDLLDDGTLVAADKNNHQVKFIDRQGRLLRVLGDGKPGRGENQFTTPEGVEIKGNIMWLSDSGNNRILKYRLDRP